MVVTPIHEFPFRVISGCWTVKNLLIVFPGQLMARDVGCLNVVMCSVALVLFSFEYI